MANVSKVIATNIKTKVKQTLTVEQAKKLREGKFADRFEFKDIAEPAELSAKNTDDSKNATDKGGKGK